MSNSYFLLQAFCDKNPDQVSLMGKTIKLIDFNFGSTNLQWPEPLKTVTEFGIQPIKTIVDLGREAVSCATSGGPLEVFKCFGLLIIQQVPPLSFLTRCSEIQKFKASGCNVWRVFLVDVSWGHMFFLGN